MRGNVQARSERLPRLREHVVPSGEGHQRQVPVVQEPGLLLREHRSRRATGGLARRHAAAAAAAAVGAACVPRLQHAGDRDEGARHRPRHRRAARPPHYADGRGRGLRIEQASEGRECSCRDARATYDDDDDSGANGDAGRHRREAICDRASDSSCDDAGAAEGRGASARRSSRARDVRRRLHVRRWLVRMLRPRMLLAPRRHLAIVTAAGVRADRTSSPRAPLARTRRSGTCRPRSGSPRTRRHTCTQRSRRVCP